MRELVRGTAWLIVVVLLAAPLPAVAQNAPRPGIIPPRDATPQRPRTGIARISGRVIDAGGEPIRRAQVQLISPAAGGPRTVTTDGEGNYQFTNLPAGTYSVTATKNGFVNGQYGQRRPTGPGTPIQLADGQSKTRIDLALMRGGVLVVRITDEFGDPIIGAQVQVQRFQYGPTGRRLTFAPTGPGSFMTDDLGQTRVFGLQPGEYVVNATMRSFIGGGPNADDRSEGYPTTYFPGTPNPAEAQAVSVAGGQEAHAGFALSAARLARIAGRVADSKGQPAGSAQVMLSPASTGAGVGTIGGAQTAPDGTFTMQRVPPGDYVLRVTTRNSNFTVNTVVQGGGVVSGVVGSTIGSIAEPGASAAPEAASMPLSVDGDITGLNITLARPGTISGRVTFEGTAARPATGQTRVNIQGLEPTQTLIVQSNPQQNGQVAADGTFAVTGAAGKVLFRVFAPNWYLKSVTLKGADITDEPLDLTGFEDVDNLRIVMTDRFTHLTGTVVDDRGQAYQAPTIVVLPEARELSQRALRVLRMGGPANIDLRGLPPGRYVAAAFPWLDQGAEWDPRVIERVRAVGERFSLVEGQKVTLSLRIVDDP